MRQIHTLIALTLFISASVSASETVDAVWKRQEIKFNYLSTEVAYSCDLMEARVKMLLRHMGAADDIKVKMPPCMGSDRPQQRFRMTVDFSALVPATDSDTETIKAEWRDVELSRSKPQILRGSDCELVERFTKYVLPSIEHQVVSGNTGCGASKHALIGRLKMKVLSPVDAEASR